jgi:PAS domain S-box-containing protein
MEMEKEIINNVNKILTSNPDLKEMIKAVHAEMKRVLDSDRMSIALFEEGGEGFRYFMLEKEFEDKEFVEGIVYPQKGTHFKRVAETGNPIIIMDTTESDSWISQKLLKEGIHSSLIFPLEYQGKIIGTMNFSSRKANRFSEDQFNLLRQIAPGLAISVQNTLLFEEMKRSEEKYRTVVEGAHDGICVIGKDYRFKYVNQKLTEIQGYNREELIGTDLRDYLDEESKAVLADREDKRKRGIRLSPHFELTILRKDGGVRNAEISARSIKDSKGDLNIIVFLKDITDHKQAEEALRRSEETARQFSQENAIMAEIGQIVSSTLNIDEVYERFAERVRDLIPFDRISIGDINSKDHTITISYVTGTDITDRSKGNAVPLAGTLAGEVVRTRMSILFQTEDMKEVTDRFPALLSTFQAGIRSLIAIPLISKDEVIGVLFFQSTQPNAYGEKDLRLAERVGHQIAGAIANAQLFIERQQAQEALRESEKRFKELFDEAPISYYELDTDGRITQVNRTELEMLGYTAQEMVGKPIWDFLEERETARRSLTAKFAGALPPAKGIERTANRKDGNRIPVLIEERILKDREGRVIGMRSTMQDHTEFKRAEEALRTEKQRFQTLSENAPFGMVMIDKDDIFKYINPKFRELFGYDLDDVPDGKTWFRKAYPDPTYRHQVISAWMNDSVLGSPKSGEKISRIYTAICKNGTEKIINFLPVKLEAGGYLMSCVDITLQKKAEEALQRSEEGAKRLAQENAIVAEIGRIVSSTLDMKEIYEHFAEEVRKLIPFDRISVGIIDLDNWTFTLAYVHGVEIEDRDQNSVFPLTGSINEEIVRRRSGVLIQIENESELGGRFPRLSKDFRLGIRSVMTVPLISKDQVIGALHLRSLKPNAYTESDLRLAERVGNQIAGAIASAQLFMERNQAEEALREFESKFRDLVENSMAGVYLIQDNVFKYVNSRFAEIHGYELEDLVDRIGIKDTIILEDLPIVEGDIRQRLKGETQPGHLEFKIVTKSQEIKTVEVFGTSTIYQGRPAVIGTLLDVTERKRTEEALCQSEEKYRTILENIEDGYYEVDLTGNLTFFNDSLCRILGYPKEELMGMNNQQYADKENAKKMLECFNQVHRIGESGRECDYEIIRKDGTKRYIEASISLQKGSSGDPIGFRGIVRDITEKKKMEEQLLQAEKLRSLAEMASGVAHDFNNALAVVLGNTQLLLYTVQDEEIKKSLRTIEKVAKDSAQTVRRLQDFTRKRAHQELFKVDVNSIIKDSIEITKPKWKDEVQSGGIHIEMASNLGEIPSVLGNASELREVITNLIFNAVEAMPEGGKIEIKAFQKKKKVYIQISDTGIGIPEEIRKKIFEPFFTTKPFTNTGLGLSMSYGIIKRFEGEIEVESKVGDGTVFRIILPAGEEERVEEVSPSTIKKGKKARILVIDDEEFVRSVLSRTLAQVDHQVTLAENGERGIQLFKERKFDIVLTDLGMPGMSGWEVCRVIKEISPHTPVGMITGWGTEMSQNKMKEYGLNFIISKPFDINKILNVVAENIDLPHEKRLLS